MKLASYLSVGAFPHRFMFTGAFICGTCTDIRGVHLKPRGVGGRAGRLPEKIDMYAKIVVGIYFLMENMAVT